MSPYERFSVKFYMVAVSFIIFDVEIVFLYPWAVVFKDLGWFGYVSMMIFLFVISAGLAYEWHVRGRPLHPQTQGKIERYHRSMKNVVKLDNYYSPGQLESKLKEFVRYYNYNRYHESLQNVTPAEVYYGKAEKRLEKREKIKWITLKARKKQNRNNELTS